MRFFIFVFIIRTTPTNVNVVVVPTFGSSEHILDEWSRCREEQNRNGYVERAEQFDITSFVSSYARRLFNK